MAGIEEKDLDSPRIGIVVGSGGALNQMMVIVVMSVRKKGQRELVLMETKKYVELNISYYFHSA